MNRIVLIGNGFDLAHKLKTSYKNFIDWYWDQRVSGFYGNTSKVSEDMLCKFTCLNDEVWSVFTFTHISVVPRPSGSEVIQYIKHNKTDYAMEETPFFKSIIHSIDTKKWVDIEEEYYQCLTQYAFDKSTANDLISLNKQLQYLKDLLVSYLSTINMQYAHRINTLYRKIYSPIKIQDISIESTDLLKRYVDSCIEQDDRWVNDKIKRYGYKEYEFLDSINYFKENYKKDDRVLYTDIPSAYLLPDSTLLLNFNYTHTADLYHNENLSLITNIHGSIEEPQDVIFGYGDELDERFKKIKETNNNECRRNIKSIKYLEADKYRYVLSFMESAPYQICIMGHSCGNSDRTLLNTLFEHRNCISIKPYYYINEEGNDNYMELIQNISRNFTDMKLMRDRVVNKTYCEPIV